MTVTMSEPPRSGGFHGPAQIRSHTPFQSRLAECAAAGSGWLLSAAAAGKRGVADFYSKPLRPPSGWAGISTTATASAIRALARYGAFAGDSQALQAASQLAFQLRQLQREDGAFPGGEQRSKELPAPSVFETGEAISALLELHTRTPDAGLLDAARKAGRWLVRNLNFAARQWTSHCCHPTSTPAYYTEVCAAMLELAKHTHEHSLHETAETVLDTLASQCNEVGGFRNWGRDLTDTAHLHYIAGTLIGFAACGQMLGTTGAPYTGVAKRISDRLRADQDARGSLAGAYDEIFDADAWYACPSGTAKLASYWLAEWRRSGSTAVLNAAMHAIVQAVDAQEVSPMEADCEGAVGGSRPLSGHHARFRYPAYATANMVLAAIDAHEALTRIVETGPCALS